MPTFFTAIEPTAVFDMSDALTLDRGQSELRTDDAFVFRSFNEEVRILASGEDLRYEKAGIQGPVSNIFNTVSGTIDNLRIFGPNDSAFGQPGIELTGFTIDGADFGRTADEVWDKILSGVTIINATAFTIDAVGSGGTILFGDDRTNLGKVSIGDGSDTGGVDFISIGNAVSEAVGDVYRLTNPAFDRHLEYTASRDQILATRSEITQKLTGDASILESGMRLFAGDDLIRFDFLNPASEAFGDVREIDGLLPGARPELFAGNDEIIALNQSTGTAVGDVGTIDGPAFVQAGDDTITGGDGGMELIGDVGEANRDGVQIVAGNDQIFGGDGDDIITGDLFSANNGTAIEVGSDTLKGGNGDDIIYGDVSPNGAGANISGDGADLIFGEDGNDELHGQNGDDTVDGGAGNDLLLGGAGNDDLSGGNGRDTLAGARGNDTLTGGRGNDDLNGGGGNDRIVAGGGGDTVGGGGGDDLMWGGGGNDILSGGRGDDAIVGEAGNDTLLGGGGNDRLVGGTGNDVITTGRGRDKVVFGEGDGRDTVTDFAVGKDLLDLRGIDLDSFEDLADFINEKRGDTIIDFGRDIGRITLTDVTGLDAGDFII